MNSKNNLVSTPVILRDNGGLDVEGYTVSFAPKAAYTHSKRSIRWAVDTSYNMGRTVTFEYCLEVIQRNASTGFFLEMQLLYEKQSDCGKAV